MTKLKNLKGTKIQFIDADPVEYVGVWSSGGTRNEQAGAIGGTIIGTQTAAVAAGGNISGSVTNKTEEYNGTGWTAGNTLGTARRSLQAAGLESAGLVFGGDTSVNSTGFSNLTETYNGTNWSEANELTTSRGAGSGAGLSTAAVAIGGSTGPGAPNYSNVVENWNGSSWSNGTSVNTARIRGGASGIQTSLLFFGGQAAPGASNSVELWNGSSWTETTEINTARGYAGSAGETSTAALFFGGASNRAITESWDGTSWTEVADMATGQSDNFGVVRGSNLSALSSGGESSPNAVSEEWSFPPATSSALQEGDMWFNSTSSTLKGFGVSIATGTFSSGGQTGSVHLDAAAGGSTQSSFMLVSGYPDLPTVEQYDGTSWTEVGDVNTARSLGGASAQAPAPTMLFYGGQEGYTNTEQYNGSSWTEVSELNTNRVYSGGGAGVSTAALCVGGYGSPAAYLTTNEEYNGSTWTEKGDLNNGRYGGATGGSSTSARCVAGAPPGPVGDKNEGWDGTTWSEQTENSDNSAGRAGFGDNKDSFMVASGNATAQSEFWNGSSWTEVGATAGSGQRFNMGGGTTSAGIIGKCSGPNPQAQSTEEFNCDNAVLTVTTS